MSTGICGNCQQAVTVINGHYTCSTCGHNGNA